MPSVLTLVDLSPTPSQAYLMLEALYEAKDLFSVEETMDVINYIEARLIDAELPLTRDVYEEEIQSPENITYKTVEIRL